MREIQLTRGKVAIVDDEHYEVLNALKWHCHATGYAARGVREGKKKKTIYMHREVMALAGEALGQHTDHVNRDKLDNRAGNLRATTASANRSNSPPQKNNASGFRGVYRDGRSNKWTAQIVVNRVRIRLGRFEEKTDAARAYDKAAMEHFGEVAYLNLAA